MFGQLRMIFTLLVIAGIAGAGMYVVKLRADNVILKANHRQTHRHTLRKTGQQRTEKHKH